MTLAGGWPYFVLLLALVSAGCQSEDTSAKPSFVSVGYGLGPLTAVPLATPAEAVAAETVAAEAVAPESLPQEKDDRYFIEFRSRYALSYGHSYVVFGRVNEAGEMVDPEVAGLAPRQRAPFPTFWAISCQYPPKRGGATVIWRNHTDRRAGGSC